MNTSLADTSYWDRLIPALGRISTESEITLMTVSDTTEIVLPDGVYPGDQLKKTIENIKPGYGGTSLGLSIAEANRILDKKKSLNPSILIVSDKRSKDLDTFKRDNISAKIFFMKIPAETKNAFIEKVSWDVPPSFRGAASKLKVSVINPHNEVLKLKCFIGGNLISEEGIPKGNHTIFFKFKSLESNYSQKGLIQLIGLSKISRDSYYFIFNQNINNRISVIGDIDYGDPLLLALNPGDASPFQTQIILPENIHEKLISESDAFIIGNDDYLKIKSSSSLKSKPYLIIASDKPFEFDGIKDEGIINASGYFMVNPHLPSLYEDIIFNTVEIYKSRKITADSNWKTLLNLNDAPPLLLYRDNIYLLNTSYLKSWSNFVNTSTFLPLIHQTLYAMLNINKKERLVGERIIWIDDENLLDPYNKIVIPCIIKGKEKTSERTKYPGWYECGKKMWAYNISEYELSSGMIDHPLLQDLSDAEAITKASKFEISWYLLFLAGFLILVELGISIL